MNEDRILLEDMVFHGRHGTLQAEQELGQPFVVSVELRLDLRPAAGTLDEHPMVEAVRVKVAKPHVRLEDTVLADSAVEVLRRREAGPGN